MKQRLRWRAPSSWNPSSSLIRLYNAMYLSAVGRFDEAVDQADLACQLDPSAMVVRGNATCVLYLAGRNTDCASAYSICTRT